MPKKKDDVAASSKVAWVEALPEGGGAWGRGIVSTVAAMEEDLQPLLEQRNELDRAVKARESILNDAVKRANREAKGLFNDGQISVAKQKIETEKAKAEEAAAANADPPPAKSGKSKGGTAQTSV